MKVGGGDNDLVNTNLPIEHVSLLVVFIFLMGNTKTLKGPQLRVQRLKLTILTVKLNP